MLTLRFVRENLIYCLVAIGGLSLLISGQLLSSLGVAEIFRDASAGSDTYKSLGDSRAFAAQFYASIFIACVFICFLAQKARLAPASGWYGTVGSAARYHLALMPLPFPILLSALLTSSSREEAWAGLAGFSLAQICTFAFMLALVREFSAASIAVVPERSRRPTIVNLVLVALTISCGLLMLKPLTSADAFFTIFGWITVIYLVVFYAPGWIFFAACCLIGGVRVAVSMLPHAEGLRPYQIPGLDLSGTESYYHQGNEARFFAPGRLEGRACSEDRLRCGRRTASELLESWRQARRLTRPKIVLVAASGGAYRATFWTALMLDRLAMLSARGGPLEGLTDHIRLVTGASGGMVGAAYFAVCGDTNDQPTPDRLTSIIERDILGPPGNTCQTMKGEALGPIDSLLPVADHFARVDLARFLLSQAGGVDRGVVLERQWRSISITFDQMVELQDQKHRPAIVFPSTIAETGTPFEITSLKYGQREGRTAQATLFDAFPAAHRTLLLSTAARLSATFPVITPAAALPTLPKPVHVVDAGYYDNDAIESVVGYLRDADVLDWLAKESSGVILIALRAFPVDAHLVKQVCDDAHADKNAASGVLAAWGATAGRLLADQMPQLPAPLSAVMNVRAASAASRSEILVEYARTLLKARSIEFEFVSLENATSVNMSWYLKRSELRCMRRAAAETTPALNSLRHHWWSHREPQARETEQGGNQ